MGSTTVAKERKHRSDMEYFNSLFTNLSPVKFQEVNWSKQGYANVTSARASVYKAITTRNLNNVYVKKSGNRLFVCSNDFMGVLPVEDITLEEAFRRADKCLTKHPDIEKWSIPERLVPHYEDLTNFQIGMKMRDILKEKYPYLTITPYDKHGFGVGRDKSYGSVCGASETKGTKETERRGVTLKDISEKVVDEVEKVMNKPAIVESVITEPTTEKSGTGRYSMVTVMPAIPFELASELAVYLSVKGYKVSMEVEYGKDRKCYGVLSFSK